MPRSVKIGSSRSLPTRLGLVSVKSTNGEMTTAAAGSGSPAALIRCSVASVRLPPAESPAITMPRGSQPRSSSQR
jgi:hypothetical protein